jgi:two-component system chemotaxis response regulator CheB
MSEAAVRTTREHDPPEQLPPRPQWMVAIAGSAGGIRAMQQLLPTLPLDLPAAVVVVLHRPPHHGNHLQEILRRRTRWPVVMAHAQDVIHAGVVYISRSDRHVWITPNGRFEYTNGRRIHFLHSSANPLLESAAIAFDGRLIAVVLSGYGRDATEGVQDVKQHGGVVIAQDRATAEVWGMPGSAVASGAVDYVLPIEQIGPAIADIVAGHAVVAS